MLPRRSAYSGYDFTVVLHTYPSEITPVFNCIYIIFYFKKCQHDLYIKITLTFISFPNNRLRRRLLFAFRNAMKIQCLQTVAGNRIF